MRKRSTSLLLAGALLGTIGITSPSQALSGWVAPRTTTITGTFQVGTKVRTIKAVSRTRTVVSIPGNLDFYSIGLNPTEVTLTLDICEQGGCDVPANRICTAPVTVTEETESVIQLVSTKASCKLEVMLDVQTAGLPRFYADKVETIAAAVFRPGAKVLGTAASGSDGRVVRNSSWGAST